MYGLRQFKNKSISSFASVLDALKPGFSRVNDKVYGSKTHLIFLWVF